MDLRIVHLYPDLMSIYGDRGNVIALERRARWRDIPVEVRAHRVDERLDPEWGDLYFFGGGQDQGQDVVGLDLQGPNGARLKEAIGSGAAILSICGGYQLLGHEYVPEDAPAIPGVGALDVRTVEGKDRLVDGEGVVVAMRDDDIERIANHIDGAGGEFHGDHGMAAILDQRVVRLDEDRVGEGPGHRFVHAGPHGRHFFLAPLLDGAGIEHLEPGRLRVAEREVGKPVDVVGLVHVAQQVVKEGAHPGVPGFRVGGEPDDFPHGFPVARARVTTAAN